jgi:hypothetical protein
VAPLLTVETNALRFELHGPHAVAGAWGTASGKLVVEASESESVEVEWTASDGSERTDNAGAGPALYEWTQYQVFAESLSGETLKIEHRDPQLVGRVTPPAHHPELLTGPISFRGQVGMTELRLRSSGHRVSIQLEVFPTKLDYASDYESLLSEVNAASQALALEYLRATYRSGTETVAEQPSDLEFATLLRHHLSGISRAMRWVAEHPHRRLVREVRLERIERLRRPSRMTKNAIRQGRGSGPWVQLGPGLRAHSRVPGVRAVETLNTPEHRWLKASIAAVNRRLADLLTSLQREIARAKSRNRSTTRLEAEEAELVRAQAQLTRLLEAEPLSEADGPVPQAFSSLTLLQMPGYREAVQGLLSLANGLSLTGGAVETSVKDVDVLYELWCFLRVASVLYELSDRDTDLSSLFEQGPSGLRTKLERGAEVEVKIGSRTRYRLAYNKRFAGFTGSQRPDLLLSVERPGWPALYLILDAKYRLEAGDDYLKQFKIPGPPEEALNQLHRYRDAIVLDHTSADRERPVVRGAALFPLDESSSIGWLSAPLGRSLEHYGIGALPFLPSNETYTEEWLRQVLGEAPSDLAVAGPPFAAAQELRARQEAARDRVLLVRAGVADLATWQGAGVADLAVPGVEAGASDQLAVLVEDLPAGVTRIAARGDISGVSPSAPGTLRFAVSGWESVERDLAGVGAAYPALTSRLALERAASVNALGLRAVAEWDLVELASQEGWEFEVSSVRAATGLLSGFIDVQRAAGVARVAYRGAAGFELAVAGAVTSYPTSRAVIEALSSL